MVTLWSGILAVTRKVNLHALLTPDFSNCSFWFDQKSHSMNLYTASSALFRKPSRNYRARHSAGLFCPFVLVVGGGLGFADSHQSML